MAIIVKIKRQSDGGIGYLHNMCHYVRDHRAIAKGGYGLNIEDPEIAFSQMVWIRKYYGQVSTNPLIQIVVSFDEGTDNIQSAILLAPKIASYFNSEFVYLWCIHHADKDSAHYHMHILLHSVNLRNGNLYHSSRYNMTGLCYHIEKLTYMQCHLIFWKDNKDECKE